MTTKLFLLIALLTAVGFCALLQAGQISTTTPFEAKVLKLDNSEVPCFIKVGADNRELIDLWMSCEKTRPLQVGQNIWITELKTLTWTGWQFKYRVSLERPNGRGTAG